MEKRIGFTRSFMESLMELNNQDQSQVFNSISLLQENSAHPSLQLHKLGKTKCDKRFQSARVTINLRMIIVIVEDECILLYVAHHDDAYDWCEGKYYDKTVFGALWLYDEKKAEKLASQFKPDNEIPDYLKPKTNSGLLEVNGVKKKNLVKLGIQDIHAENLLKISDEDSLLKYIEFLPEEIQEALIDLSTGSKQFDEVYNDLCSQNEDKENNDSSRRIYLTDNLEEIRELVENEDFEKWTLFLHPSQKRLVTMNCNGPMLIEGGPGTGKTVVGMHRAVRLASEIYPKANGGRVLFCTYSKKLASYIEQKIIKLCKQKGVDNNIDVMSVDSYILKLLGDNALPVDIDEIGRILKRVYKSKSWKYSYYFYVQEYYEVVEKYNISTKEDYLKQARKGSGKAINKTGREEIWEFFETVLKEKKINSAYSFVDRAFQLDRLIDDNEVREIYDTIIIDEAQDLESIKLRVLNKSVKNTKNGTCILSDHNQRIFRLNSWTGDAGISIVGRTYHLKVNYRTTKQIDEYARSQFVDLDLGENDCKDYVSITSGDKPEIQQCKTDSEENKFIFERVKKYMSVCDANDICILAPTYEKLNKINAIFEYEDIGTDLLSGDETIERNGHIKLCTTSGVKGLEFSIIVIASFNKIGTQRQTYGSAPEAEINYEKLVECEKYVAITRARDMVLLTYVGG